jgi:hypothetical protein
MKTGGYDSSFYRPVRQVTPPARGTRRDRTTISASPQIGRALRRKLWPHAGRACRFAFPSFPFESLVEIIYDPCKDADMDKKPRKNRDRSETFLHCESVVRGKDERG